MLADRDLELLTAYVDGELTRRERKAVLRLLHESSEARALVRDLQENVYKLRALPVVKLPETFTGQLLEVIAERGAKPAPVPEAPVTLPLRRVPRWLGYAAAAAILLSAVGLGMLLGRRGDGDEPIARVPTPQPAFQVAFKDLGDASKRERFGAELKKEKAVHLDVTVQDNAKAVNRLKDALKEKNIGLLVDARAQTGLKDGKTGKTYFVYIENVQPDELEGIMRQLANDDVKAQTPFQSMQVTALTGTDREGLGRLLGVSAAEIDTPRPIRKKEGEKTPSKKGTIPSAERFALVLPGPDETGALTSEVQAFLASRQDHRPGAMQVLMVLHQA